MSNCIKDLYDYDLIKKCYRCGIISLKSNFHKNKKSKDELSSVCKGCRKDYYLNNSIKLFQKQKDYYKKKHHRIKHYKNENREKFNDYSKKYIKQRRRLDVNFRLILITRSRIHHALNGKTKSSSTLDILGIDIETYKKWIEFQMTPEMNWENIEIDHVKPICMFDVTKDEEMKEGFNWKNTQPLLKQDHLQKGIKFNFLDYQSQFFKAYQFIKLNEERFNENIH